MLLRNLRLRNGGSAEEIAEFIGVSVDSYYKYEREERTPRDKRVLAKLCAYHGDGLTSDHILGIVEYPYPIIETANQNQSAPAT